MRGRIGLPRSFERGVSLRTRAKLVGLLTDCFGPCGKPILQGELLLETSPMHGALHCVRGRRERKGVLITDRGLGFCGDGKSLRRKFTARESLIDDCYRNQMACQPDNAADLISWLRRFTIGVSHRYRFSFRLPQCVSLRSELNIRSASCFIARINIGVDRSEHDGEQGGFEVFQTKSIELQHLQR
jgi:hypothetical protein